EVHRVARVAQRLVEVGGPLLEARLLGELLQLRRVAADEDRVGEDGVLVRDPYAALLYDRQDGADEVLVRPHPARHAVHDHANAVRRHPSSVVVVLRPWAVTCPSPADRCAGGARPRAAAARPRPPWAACPPAPAAS